MGSRKQPAVVYRVAGQFDGEEYFGSHDVVQTIEWARGARVGHDVGQPITVQYKVNFRDQWEDLPGVNYDAAVTKSMPYEDWALEQQVAEERARVIELIRYHKADAECEGIGPEEQEIINALTRLERDVYQGKQAP